MSIRSAALRSTVTCLAAAAAAPLAAQTSTSQPEIQACYDSRTSSTGTPLGSGIVYRIKVPGVVGQQGCVDPKHTPFGWTIQHGALTGLGNDDHPQYVLANGTRALTGPLQAGGFKITGLGAGATAGDAVRFQQAVKVEDPAGGDLAGTYPNPAVARLQGRAVSSTAPTDGNVLTFNVATTTWEPRAPAAASGTSVNTPNTLVQRDASGGFASGSLTIAGFVTASAFRGNTLTLSPNSGVALLATGPIQSTTGGFMFPDGSVQLSAAAGGASGTPNNTPNSLVQRDASGGFAAGSVLLNQLIVGGASVGAQVNPDGGFLAVGNTNGVIPRQGTGVRMMWHPGKGAFRAGEAFAGEWDDASVGELSTAMGSGTTASGPRATAMGNRTTASGDASTAMGNLTTASGIRATAMGEFTTASGTSSTAMGAFASTNDQRGSFVYGDASTIPLGFSLVQATAPNQFVVRAAGGTIFYSSPDLSSGVSLAPGAGAWASVSDVRRKENFREVDGESVLGRIARMPVREWNYRTQAASVRHLGPTAQDFRAAFGLGESDTTITTTDIDGINLLAVQALERRTREQAREIETLRAELAALRAAIAQRRE